MTEPTFTVYTPTYNRAHTLPRTYAGLQAQTLRDFEWLIIDDGSIDGTGDLVAGWQAEAPFPIRYLWKENGGKHTADNISLVAARGRFLLQLGSDDALLPNALADLWATWESIPAAERDQFAFVAGLCVDQHGATIGDPFPVSPLDTTLLDVTYRLKVGGDKCIAVVTAIARRYPLPVLGQRTTHIPEAAAFTRIARHYRSRYVNIPMYEVHIEPTSLTRQQGPRAPWMRRIAPGFTAYYAQVLNEHTDYFRDDPKRFVIMAAHYARFSFYQGRSLRKQWGALYTNRARALYLAGLPLALAAYARDHLPR